MLNQKLNDEILGVAASFISFGFSPSVGNILPYVLKELEPDGETAMRDSILKGCQVILELYQLIKNTRFADQYNFVMIVLTDGMDECSKASTNQTIACLNEIRDQIPTHVLKIIFIGVDIDDQTEWQLRTLSDAAGKNAEYLNISTDQLSGVFQKLTLKLGLQKRHQVLEARNSMGEGKLLMSEEYKDYLHLTENYYGVLFNLDMSGSMKGNKWSKVCAGTEYFIRCLGEGDFVGCMVFNDENVLVPLNKSQIQEIVQETNNEFAAQQSNPQPYENVHGSNPYSNQSYEIEHGSQYEKAKNIGNYNHLNDSNGNLMQNNNVNINVPNNNQRNYGLTGAVNNQGSYPQFKNANQNPLNMINNLPLNNGPNYPTNNNVNYPPPLNYPHPPPLSYNHPPPTYPPAPTLNYPAPPLNYTSRPLYPPPPRNNDPLPPPIYTATTNMNRSPQNFTIVNGQVIQTQPQLPFYRRRNGRVTILIIVFIVIAIAVLSSVLSK